MLFIWLINLSENISDGKISQRTSAAMFHFGIFSPLTTMSKASLLHMHCIDIVTGKHEHKCLHTHVISAQTNVT